MQNNQQKGKKKIGSIILNVIIWIFVVFSMVVSLVVLSSTAFNDDGTGVPSLGGYSLITIKSNSMKPEFSKGALIVVKKATAEQRTQYKEDDIITYFDYNDDGTHIFVTHRITEVKELAVTTYTVIGDNKDFDLSGGTGETVFCNDVLGHYTGIAIPGLGGFLDFIKEPLGFGLIIILPLIAFFLYELYNFIRTLIEVKGKPVTVTISQEDEEEIKKRAIEEYLRQLREQEASSASDQTPGSQEDKQE